MKFPFTIVIVLLQILRFASPIQYEIINIGGIFPKNEDGLVNAFQKGARLQNREREYVKIYTNVTKVDTNDSFEVQKAVCDMIEKNKVIAIFGPNSPKTTNLVSSICKRLEIPYIRSVWQPIDIDDFNSTGSFTRNLFPHPKLYSDALMEIIRSFRWMKIAVIYDSEMNLAKLQNTFNDFSRVDNSGKQSIAFYKLPTDTDDYQPLLKSLSKSGHVQIIIDCTIKNTYSVLKQTINIGMTNEYVSYFLLGDDAYTINLSPLASIRANITTIRFLDTTKPEIYTDLIANEAALLQDAVTVFSKAFTDNATFYRQFNMEPLSCNSVPDEDVELPFIGKTILNNIDENTVEGLTGNIRFDTDGLRNLFIIEVLELVRNSDVGDSYKKIAFYNPENGITLLRNFTNIEEETAISMQAKVFKVILREGMPFLRKKPDLVYSSNMTDIDMYEGFATDLIKEIARECKFRYEIKVEDMENGKKDPETGHWTGLIGEIVNKRADLAIGDITVTHSRKTVMDFSTPFMTLGISILYAKPHKEKAGLFSFMDPLSMHVWLHMATAFLCISITEFLLAKMTASDWENPHPCDEDPEELENIWNMHNCIWLTVGSIMQQGCDILPKGIPTRLAAAVWWFFALIVISSYTANLAAFLTKERMEESIGSVDDLASQSQIRYGLQAGGSTESFFKNSNYSMYQKMWSVMEKAEPTVFVKTNDEGVKKVKQSSRMYAYFMESAPIKYIIHRECNLTQVGGLLDSKEYGIGMPLNSPYRTAISQAILHLQESGKISELTTKWWETKDKDENGNEIDCEADEKEQTDTPELGMDNVGGVFLVLAIGIVLSIFIGILEFIWSIRRTSIDERITPYEAFKKELKFSVSVWKNRKPIARMSSAGSSIGSNSSNEGDDIQMDSMKNSKQNGLNSF